MAASSEPVRIMLRCVTTSTLWSIHYKRSNAVQAATSSRVARSSQHGLSKVKQGACQLEQTAPFPVLLSRTAYQMLVEQVRLIAPSFCMLLPCAWQTCMIAKLSK